MADEGAIVIDRSTPGMVRITYPGCLVADEEMDRYLADVSARLPQRTEPFVVLVVIKDGAMFSPRQRRRQADFLNTFAEALRRFCRGQAFVITSRVGRGLLRAVLWLAPPPQPWRVFHDVETAYAWLEGQLGRTLERQSADGGSAPGSFAGK